VAMQNQKRSTSSLSSSALARTNVPKYWLPIQAARIETCIFTSAYTILSCIDNIDVSRLKRAPPVSLSLRAYSFQALSEMCFYEQYQFVCGDWKWGNFREHCNKEYRMGETCGMKLVYQVKEQPSKCKFCEKVDTKLRRIEEQRDRIARWIREGRNPASIEKSKDTIRQLDYEIEFINREISFRRGRDGNHSQLEQPEPEIACMRPKTEFYQRTSGTIAPQSRDLIHAMDVRMRQKSLEQAEIWKRLDMLALQIKSIGFDTGDEDSQYNCSELSTVSKYPTLTQ
jgi:hypothetical protein